ncbi:MAG: FtsX-like permease family protein, partial [Faecousia sp.]
MESFSQVYRHLRRTDRKQYVLLSGCCCFCVLLITAYACMMRSPTVLNVLPEGGDSRKQVMMIFVLAVIGCGVFTVYAASLFFRQKSRQLGIFLALGATRYQLKRELTRELAVLAVLSCGTGAVLGGAAAWGIWQLFRLWVVDTQEMSLTFDPKCSVLPLAFSVFVLVALVCLGSRSIRRTNILDIVQESRKSEPVRDVPLRYGAVGIFLLILGGGLGYGMPSFFVLVLHWYPPEGLSAIFYLPALAGLYMILLHTVVNGWSRKKHRYRDLIATSMMKFQGRQTVNNMLVMTLLIAGAYFASFYAPMLGVGAMMAYDARPVDYAYFYRADQDLPDEAEVRVLAEEYGVTITSWAEVPMARLAVDGYAHVETEGPLGITWEEVYREVLCSKLFLSESAYEALTGEPIDLKPGEITGILDASGDGQGVFGGSATLVTNYLTKEHFPVAPVDTLKNDVLFGRFVVDDQDYAAMTRGLTDQWRETMVFFNVEDCQETYAFANALFNRIVDASGPEVELYDSWDPVARDIALAEKGEYFLDTYRVRYDQRDSSEFRLSWQYMPQFRVLDKADFGRTMAVYLLLFVFIAVICFAAVTVIGFTRSMTIALVNRQVYEDMRKLG